MADIESLGGAEAEAVPPVEIVNTSLETTNLGTSQPEIETMQQDEPNKTEDIENEFAEAGDNMAGDIEAGYVEARDVEARNVQVEDVEAGDIEASNAEVRDGQAGDIEEGNAEVWDREVGDIEAGNAEVWDRQAGDIELEAGNAEVWDRQAGDIESGNAEVWERQAGVIEAGNAEVWDREVGDIEAGDMEAVDIELPPMDNETARSTNSCSGYHEKVLKTLLLLAVFIICALIAVVVYQDLAPCQPKAATSKNNPLPQRFYDENYMRYLAYFPPGSRSNPSYLTKREVLWQADACGTQLNREPSDPLFFTSNQNIPLEPAVTGFMGQFGTYRFLSMFEMMAMFIGEEKHGMWRFQENGFIRVYRDKSSNVGIFPVERKRAIESGLYYVDAEKYTKDDTLLGILKNHYMNVNPALDFDYAFGDDTSIIINTNGRRVEVLNWIDLPIYHEKFTRKYRNHAPIDTPAYFCQVSSDNFPHAKVAWQLITAQEKANKVGPLGIRAGLDIKENFHKIIRFNQFPGATAWANIGQGNPETDERPKTLEEMRERPQTVNYTPIDQNKVDIEIYLAERGYRNSSVTYLQFIVVMMDKSDPEAYTYLRPDGYYYDVLVKRNTNAKNINQEPRFNFKISIRGEEEQKRVYSTVVYALSNLNRPKFGLTGGGCPAKGGDIIDYPWGNPGSGFETNYEEVIPVCDAILIDIRFWTNLGDPLDDPAVKIGNSGIGYNSTKIAEYVTQPNFYGRFTDPYNVKNNIQNPDELDFTTDHKMQGPKNHTDENVTFRIDFGKIGTLNKVNFPENIDIAPVSCVAESENKNDYCGP